MNEFFFFVIHLNGTKTLSLGQRILAGTQIATFKSLYHNVPEEPIIFLRSVVY